MKIRKNRSNQVFKGKSGNELSPDVFSAVLTRKNLESFNYIIPEENNLRKLDLSYNSIKSLPYGLNVVSTLFLPYNEISELPTDLTNVLASYQQLSLLDLSHNLIETFPPGVEQLKALKNLDLSSNKIEFISQIKSSADTIDLSNNMLEIVPKVRKDLRHLYLDHNKIMTFDKSFKHLIKISLGYNRLKNIIPTISLFSIEELILSHNLLKTIPDLIKFAPKLRVLDASFNKITVSPTFPLSIEYIDLSYNKIPEIPANMKDFVELKNLNMSHNKIKVVPNLPPSVIYINFYDNFIQTVEDSETPNLRGVNLVSNCLTKTPVFKGNKLPFVSLRNNSIGAFEWDFEENFLTKIDLSNNNLETISQEIFNLQYLYILNLSSNKITKFEFDFSNSHISTLNLSNNKIEKLPSRLPQRLEYLIISNCGLSSFPDDFEKINKEIYYLNISENNISSIPVFSSLAIFKASHNNFSTFPTFSESIEFIDLSFNKINFIPLIRLPRLSFVDLSFNQMVSFNCPSSVKHLLLASNPGLTSLKIDSLDHLDISNCPCEDTIPENVRQFITSNVMGMSNSTLTTFCHSFSEKYCITQHKCRDVFFGYQQAHGSYLFCILNAHDTQAVSQKTVYLMLGKLHEKKAISGESLRDLCDNMVAYIDKSFISPTTMFTLGFVRSKSLIIAYYGGFVVTILDDKGEVMAEYGRESNREEGLANLQKQGEKMVYNIKRGTALRQIVAKDREKWAIVGPALVLDTFSKETYCEIISTSADSTEIARRLKNHAVAAPFKQSFSIGVFDFG